MEPPDAIRAASLIARGWKHYVWLRFCLELEGPLGAEGDAPETAANLDESGADPLQQPPPFRFLQRSSNGQPAIATAWADAAARLLQRAWTDRQRYVRWAGLSVGSLVARRVALHRHRYWLARRVASSRDQRSEIRCYGRVLLELSDLLPDLDEFLDVSSP